MLSKNMISETEGRNFNQEFLEMLVYEWIRRMKYYLKRPMKDPFVIKIASEFKDMLNLKCFSPTQEWINGFRLAYDVRMGDRPEDHAYPEWKSILIKDIFNDLLPAWKAKISSEPKVVMKRLRMTDESTSLNRKFLLMDGILVDKNGVSLVVGPSDGKRLRAQFLEAIDIEDMLPKSVCIVKGSFVPVNRLKQETSVGVGNEVKTEEIKQKDNLRVDIEDWLPTTVCSVACAETNPRNVQTLKSAKKSDGIDDGPGPPKKQKFDKSSEKKALRQLEKSLEVVKSPAYKFKNQHRHISPLSRISMLECIGPLRTSEEALKCVKLLEEFALMQENYRLIGHIERLENILTTSD